MSRLHALGWQHRIGLREGVESTYRWFTENIAQARMDGQTRAQTSASLSP